MKNEAPKEQREIYILLGGWVKAETQSIVQHPYRVGPAFSSQAKWVESVQICVWPVIEHSCSQIVRGNPGNL